MDFTLRFAAERRKNVLSCRKRGFANIFPYRLQGDEALKRELKARWWLVETG